MTLPELFKRKVTSYEDMMSTIDALREMNEELSQEKRQLEDEIEELKTLARLANVIALKEGYILKLLKDEERRLREPSTRPPGGGVNPR